MISAMRIAKRYPVERRRRGLYLQRYRRMVFEYRAVQVVVSLVGSRFIAAGSVLTCGEGGFLEPVDEVELSLELIGILWLTASLISCD